MVHVLEASLPVWQFREVVEPLRHEAKRKLGSWSQGAWKGSRSKFLQEWAVIKNKNKEEDGFFPLWFLIQPVPSFSHTFPSHTQAFAVRPDVLLKVRHKTTQCSYSRTLSWVSFALHTPQPQVFCYSNRKQTKRRPARNEHFKALAEPFSAQLSVSWYCCP